MNKISIGLVISIVIGIIFFIFYEDDYSRANNAFDNGDFHMAIQLYEKECNSNNMKACGDAGYSYHEGLGVRENLQMAIQRWIKGCGGKDQYSCFMLSMKYLIGEGVEQDEEKALEMVGILCDKGYEDGCEAYKKYKPSYKR